MKKLLLCVPFMLAAALFYPQESREEVEIYIPRPTGGNSEQQAYFHENFIMETAAAGYAITDVPGNSDYILYLTIKPNMILYDDGTQDMAPPEEPQNILELRLVRTDDSVDIIQFEFAFNDLEDMYEFNLYLLYQAMANVPLTKRLGVVEDDHWRNKWFYLRTSLDFNVPAYIPDIHQFLVTEIDSHGQEYTTNFPVSQLVPFAPGLSVGLELHFLNWMSAELDLSILLGNVTSITYNYDPVATIDVSLKFPIKPPAHYMIEPFIGVCFPKALLGVNLPFFGIQGGVQVATKAGQNGGFFVNLRGEYDFGKASTKTPTDPPENVKWTRFVIGLGAGYKLGFGNRIKD